MKFDLLKIIGSVVGFFVAWKIIFLFFPPEGTIAMLITALILVVAYGIQPVKWTEENKILFFGITLYRSRKFKQQYRIFGIIPIWPQIDKNIEREIFPGLGPKIAGNMAIKSLTSFIPFGLLLL